MAERQFDQYSTTRILHLSLNAQIREILKALDKFETYVFKNDGFNPGAITERVNLIEAKFSDLSQWRLDITEWQGAITAWQRMVESWMSKIDEWKEDMIEWREDTDAWRNVMTVWKEDVDKWRVEIDEWKEELTTRFEELLRRLSILEVRQKTLDTLQNRFVAHANEFGARRVVGSEMFTIDEPYIGIKYYYDVALEDIPTRVRQPFSIALKLDDITVPGGCAIVRVDTNTKEYLSVAGSRINQSNTLEFFYEWVEDPEVEFLELDELVVLGEEFQEILTLDPTKSIDIIGIREWHHIFLSKACGHSYDYQSLIGQNMIEGYDNALGARVLQLGMELSRLERDAVIRREYSLHVDDIDTVVPHMLFIPDKTLFPEMYGLLMEKYYNHYYENGFLAPVLGGVEYKYYSSGYDVRMPYSPGRSLLDPGMFPLIATWKTQGIVWSREFRIEDIDVELQCVSGSGFDYRVSQDLMLITHHRSDSSGRGGISAILPIESYRKPLSGGPTVYFTNYAQMKPYNLNGGSFNGYPYRADADIRDSQNAINPIETQANNMTGRFQVLATGPSSYYFTDPAMRDACFIVFKIKNVFSPAKLPDIPVTPMNLAGQLLYSRWYYDGQNLVWTGIFTGQARGPPATVTVTLAAERDDEALQQPFTIPVPESSALGIPSVFEFNNSIENKNVSFRFTTQPYSLLPPPRGLTIIDYYDPIESELIGRIRDILTRISLVEMALRVTNARLDQLQEAVEEIFDILRALTAPPSFFDQFMDIAMGLAGQIPNPFFTIIMLGAITLKAVYEGVSLQQGLVWGFMFISGAGGAIKKRLFNRKTYLDGANNATTQQQKQLATMPGSHRRKSDIIDSDPPPSYESLSKDLPSHYRLGWNTRPKISTTMEVRYGNAMPNMNFNLSQARHQLRLGQPVMQKQYNRWSFSGALQSNGMIDYHALRRHSEGYDWLYAGVSANASNENKIIDSNCELSFGQVGFAHTPDLHWISPEIVIASIWNIQTRGIKEAEGVNEVRVYASEETMYERIPLLDYGIDIMDAMIMDGQSETTKVISRMREIRGKRMEYSDPRSVEKWIEHTIRDEKNVRDSIGHEIVKDYEQGVRSMQNHSVGLPKRFFHGLTSVR